MNCKHAVSLEHVCFNCKETYKGKHPKGKLKNRTRYLLDGREVIVIQKEEHDAFVKGLA
jgi:hypothetical protein